MTKAPRLNFISYLQDQCCYELHGDRGKGSRGDERRSLGTNGPAYARISTCHVHVRAFSRSDVNALAADVARQ